MSRGNLCSDQVSDQGLLRHKNGYRLNISDWGRRARYFSIYEAESDLCSWSATFLFSYAKSRISHDAAQIRKYQRLLQNIYMYYAITII